MNKTNQKPFLKWAGGKYNLLDNILPKIPDNINNYHEIFLGGGSVLLGVLSQKNILNNIKGNIYAYDLNEALINCFKQVKNNSVDLINNLDTLVSEFSSIKINTLNQRGKPDVTINNYNSTREHYYYWIRSKFNDSEKNTLENASYFIFLNKTGYGGMYRESSSGEFNIPYGKKKSKNIPTIFDRDVIINVSRLIQNVTFIHSDFTESLKKVKKDDFAYLDPPYVPVKNKDSFVGYTKNSFDLKKHTELFKQIKNLKNVKFIMSNSNEELVRTSFQNFNINYITARRAINSSNPADTASEVIICKTT